MPVFCRIFAYAPAPYSTAAVCQPPLSNQAAFFGLLSSYTPVIRKSRSACFIDKKLHRQASQGLIGYFLLLLFFLSHPPVDL